MAEDSTRTGISAAAELVTPAGAPAGARLDASAWRVIVASSLGAIFEWYDFFLFGAAAQLLSEQFFPAGNAVASRLLVFATFGAGFAVRPAGALLFGVLGDRVGRKHTFLITIVLMGTATATMGLLPTFSRSGLLAPALLVFLRLVQGLALGGEYGGAAIYVAEHAPSGRRGLHTSFIQLAGAVGFLLALTVVLAVHGAMNDTAWHRWGWRIPFLLSFALLAGSVYVRLKLKESPVFEAMKRDGILAPSPLRESVRGPNLRRTLVALFGISAGLTVTWFTAQFTSLYLLQQWAVSANGRTAIDFSEIAGTGVVAGDDVATSCSTAVTCFESQSLSTSRYATPSTRSTMIARSRRCPVRFLIDRWGSTSTVGFSPSGVIS